MLAPIQEERTCQQTRNGAADTGFEAVLCPFFVVLEQLVYVVSGYGPSIGPLGQRRNDLPSASGLRIGFRVLGWMTDEYAVAAWGRTDARRVERSPNLERAHAIHAFLAAAGCEHLPLIVGFGERAAFERSEGRRVGN